MNTLSNGLRLRLLCGLALTLLACDLDSKDLNGGTETGGDTGTDTETDGTGEVPPDCESIIDEDLCLTQTDECVWRSSVRAVRSGDSCEVEPTGVCFDVDIQNGSAGCGELEGCDGLFASPHFRVEPDGDVTLVDFCGGTLCADLGAGQLVGRGIEVPVPLTRTSPWVWAGGELAAVFWPRPRVGIELGTLVAASITRPSFHALDAQFSAGAVVFGVSLGVVTKLWTASK